MNDTNTGGPAFPCDSIVERNEQGHMSGFAISCSGITVRDYFAAKAIQGIVVGRAVYANEWAKAAYEVADAMLAIRERKEP